MAEETREGDESSVEPVDNSTRPEDRRKCERSAIDLEEQTTRDQEETSDRHDPREGRLRHRQVEGHNHQQPRQDQVAQTVHGLSPQTGLLPICRIGTQSMWSRTPR